MARRRESGSDRELVGRVSVELVGHPPLVPGARFDFMGTCNRCGLCCTADRDGQRLVCEHLRAEKPVKPLGQPEASRCAVYEYRHQLRPLKIRLLNGSGVAMAEALCFKDTWQEDHVIADRGIGQGCSLTIPIHRGQLVKFEPAKR